MATEAQLSEGPKLKDLVFELREVDWKLLGIQLNVPKYILGIIDREKFSEFRKVSDVLQYWIDNEPAVSWEKIILALQRIGSHGSIINRIQLNYITQQPPQTCIMSPVFSDCLSDHHARSIAEGDTYYEKDLHTRPSLEEELSKFPAELLDRPFSGAHQNELTKYIDRVNYCEWSELPRSLDLDPEEVSNLPKITKDKVSSGKATSRSKEMLIKWREKFGEKANYRCLITALHKADNVNFIEDLLLVAVQMPKFPAGLLDIPCADIFLDKFGDSCIQKEELSRVTAESDQESLMQLVRAFTSNGQCVGALHTWRNNCEDEANYRCLITFFSKAHRVDLIDKLLHIINLKWYSEYLKREYLEVLFSSKVYNDQWLPSPTKKIFHLAIIKKEKIQRGKIDDEFIQRTIRGQIDDILLQKSPIELRNLFKNIAGERKVILIDGAPGSGKSTLTVHICQEWGRGELFTKFTVVILVQLRDPEVQSAQSIADLLYCEDYMMAEQAAAEIMAVKGCGVLWILDGWDELPPHLSKESIVSKLINPKRQENPLSKTAVIVTSRPISSGDLCPLVSSRFEVLGFTAEEQRLFFIECLNNDTKDVDTLMERLSRNPAMEGSCYLPLNASIVAHLYLSNRSLPSTIYGIFSSLVQHCLSRYLCERQGVSLELSTFESLYELPHSLCAPFKKLCKLAFTGARENKVTFSVKDLELLQASKEVCELGILQAVPSIITHGRSVYYNFLHLSIQEMLAAVHISRMPASKQISTFDSMFNEARFGAVLQFYAAITKLRTSRPLLSLIPRFLRPVPASIYDLVRKIIRNGSKVLLVSLLNCLYEAQDVALCKFVAELTHTVDPTWDINFEGVSLLPQDCLSIGYFLASIFVNLKRKFTVNLTSCSLGNTGAKILMHSLCKGLDSQSETGYLSMYMGSNQITGEGALYIAEVMRTTQVLRGLYLYKNSIGGKGLQYIAEALKTNTSLTELNLRQCSLTITEENGPILTEMLQRNKTLKQLDLSLNNPISDHQALFIIDGLKKNITLQTLDLTGFSITLEGSSLIQKCTSTCEIYKLW